MKIINTIALWILCVKVFLYPFVALGDEKERIISLEIAASLSKPPFLVVYIDGELSGLAPGMFKVPISDRGTPVEIGFRQFTFSPIYSLMISNEVVKSREVDITVTTLNIDTKSNYNDFWSAVEINDNIDVSSKIRADGNIFTIRLPDYPYSKLHDFWSSVEITEIDPAWYGEGINIDQYQEEITTYHWTPIRDNYDRPTRTLISSWSGSHSRLGTNHTERSSWRIETNPPEAIVRNELGELGATTVVQDIEVSESSYLSIKKNGYVDVIYSCIRDINCEPHEYCTKNTNGNIWNLSCELRKVQ